MMILKNLMMAIIITMHMCWPIVGMAQDSSQRMTILQKCELYKKLWISLTANAAKSDLSQPFFQSHEDFINGGCNNYRGVCPTTVKDLELANKLTVGAMSSGLASTFLPFKCSSAR